LEFANTSRPESVLIQMSLELLQLEVGTGQLIFDADYSQWGLLATQCWLKSIWAFVSFAQVHIIPEFSPVPTLQCQNDAFFMDHVALLHLSSSKLLAINHCQMVQKVVFISDILDGWGTSLHQPVLHPP